MGRPARTRREWDQAYILRERREKQTQTKALQQTFYSTMYFQSFITTKKLKLAKKMIEYVGLSIFYSVSYLSGD